MKRQKARGVEHFDVITAFQDVFNNSWDRLKALDVSVWKKTEEGSVQNAKSLLVSRQYVNEVLKIHKQFYQLCPKLNFYQLMICSWDNFSDVFRLSMMCVMFVNILVPFYELSFNSDSFNPRMVFVTCLHLWSLGSIWPQQFIE